MTPAKLDNLRAQASAGDRNAELIVRAGDIADLIDELDGSRAVAELALRRFAQAGRLVDHAALKYRAIAERLDREATDLLVRPRHPHARAILDLAIKIGRHWRDQEGVNGTLLDELAQLVPERE